MKTPTLTLSDTEQDAILSGLRREFSRLLDKAETHRQHAIEYDRRGWDGFRDQQHEAMTARANEAVTVGALHTRIRAEIQRVTNEAWDREIEG